MSSRVGQEYIIRIAGNNGQTDNYTLLITKVAECIKPPVLDTNNDCKIDLVNFAVFASEWLTCGLDNQILCWQ